ncbi:MAG: formylmethanofuran dehydrogenase subunit C [Solirubrobacterales bacterium]|nr:formylmethanofuran dehydrogenase subunit C [Solirubrobacterales bacterium]
MSLTLTLRAQPPARVIAAPLIPERLRGLNASAVAAVKLRCGGETVAAGDLFEVSGAGAEEEKLVLTGDLRRFDGIGAGMSSGEIETRGDVGAWGGAEMSGGVLRIVGDAGARLGAAYPGARVGMTGGEIVVSGDAGEEAGAGMRRGLVAVGGRTGAGAGLRMLAGTVIALGGIGDEAGLGNKRGSLVSGRAVEPLPVYALAIRFRPPALRLQLRRIRELGLPVGDELIGGSWSRWSGDRTELARGEILIFDEEEVGA